jgi:hypothetical protein
LDTSSKGRRPLPEGGTHAWFARFLAGLAVAAAIAIGIGAIVLLHAHPRASGPPAATMQTRPSPPPGLTGILAVLRRPQTATDLDPELPRNLENRSPLPLAALIGTPVRSLIRLATVTPWGERVFLVPTRPPTHAATAKLLAASKLPPVDRRSLLDRLERQGRRLTLGINGPGTTTVAQIQAGDDWESTTASRNTLIVVVPNGVARVTVQLSRPLTAIVHNNVAAFDSPRPIERNSVGKMIWYTQSGAIFDRPKDTSGGSGLM